MSPSSCPALSLEKVTLTYGDGKLNEVTALNAVDLTVERGERIAIIGPSGAGKSSLLAVSGCLEKPTSGRVFVAGQDVGGIPPRRRALFRNRHIGFIFQHHHLVPSLSVRDNVAVPLRYRGVGQFKAREHSEYWIERVGLTHRIDHTPAELSGGELQRTAVARALIGQPEIVLADEPTGELDSESAARLVSLLVELNVNEHVTFVIVTHDDNVASNATRVLNMNDGSLSQIPHELPQ